VGKTVTIYGGESSGKTTLVLRFIASAQRYCSNCYRVPITATVMKLESGDTVVSFPDGVGGYVDLLTGKSVPLEKIETTEGTLPFCDCYKQKLFVPKPLPGDKDDFEPKDDFERRVESYQYNSYEPVLATYNDVEGDLDVPWARTIGVDLDRLAISTGDTGEEVADVVAYQIQSCNTDIVVVDSLAMMTPTTELEDSANDSRVGVQPRLLNHCMRVWTQARVNAWRKHGRRVTVILVNQWRMKIDKFGGGPQVVGGMGQRFVGSIQLRCWEGKAGVNDVDVGKKGSEFQMARTARTCFKVEKNKTFGSKGVEGEIDFFVRNCADGQIGEVDEFDDIWRLARYFKVVEKGEKPGKWLVFGREFDTETAGKEAVRADKEFAFKMREHLLGLMLQKINQEGTKG
jgi:RecA/RadA recombinase